MLFLGKSIEGEIIPDPEKGDTIYTELAELKAMIEQINGVADVQDSEGNSLVDPQTKIAIVPAGGKQIEIVRTVAGVDRSIYTPAELKAYVDARRGLLYKGNVVISYSYVDDEVDGFFTAYYFVGAANFQGQQIRNDKSITTLSGLPARPMFTAEYEKLRNIEARAEVNKVNDVQDEQGNSLINPGTKIAIIPNQSLTDTQIIEVCALFADFISDENGNILGADSQMAIAF